MPKISKHGGATYAAGSEATPTVPDPVGLGTGGLVESDLELPDESGPEQIRGGSEQPSAGNSSSTSHEKPQTNDEPNKPAPPRRARMTASRSGKASKGTSTARSTATSGHGTDA